MGNVANHLTQGVLGGGQLPVCIVQLCGPLLHQPLQIFIDPFHLFMGVRIAAGKHDALAENQKKVGYHTRDIQLRLQYRLRQRGVDDKKNQAEQIQQPVRVSSNFAASQSKHRSQAVWNQSQEQTGHRRRIWQEKHAQHRQEKAGHYHPAEATA